MLNSIRRLLPRQAETKNVEMVHVKEIQPLTGYIRGGVSPIAVKKRHSFFLDKSAMRFPYISISAGERGSQILISLADLIKALALTLCEITRS
jgi:Cys-tRNA(Pro)/Cys-tRNA(Cys) deacylase